MSVASAAARVQELRTLIEGAPAPTTTTAPGFDQALMAATSPSPMGLTPAGATATATPAGATPFAAEIDAAATRNGVDPALLRALIRQESNFDPSARRARPDGARQPGARDRTNGPPDLVAVAPPAARAPAADPPAPAPDDEPDGPRRRRRRGARTLERALVEHGVEAPAAAAIVGEAVSHLAPFRGADQLEACVRERLAHRIGGPPTRAPGRRVIAFAGAGGAGKTLCSARLAAAYAAGSDLNVSCLSLRSPDGATGLAALLGTVGIGAAAVDARALAARIAAAGDETLVVLDTPAVAPSDAGAVRTLAGELRAAAVDEIHLTLPVTLSGPAAREALAGLSALGATAVVLTHVDETEHIAPALAAAVAAGLPVAYTSSGTGVPGALAPADPAALAAALLP